MREISLHSGKIYTAGTNFTRPAVVTNLNSEYDPPDLVFSQKLLLWKICHVFFKYLFKYCQLLRKKCHIFRIIIAVSGPTEHCPIFHFPSVRPSSVLRHRRDILTFFDILTVYTMKTIYFLNAYHLGWPPGPPGPPGPAGSPEFPGSPRTCRPPGPPGPPCPPGQPWPTWQYS